LYENKMIQRLLLPTVLFHLVCGLAKAGELPEINFVKIVFLSGWTKSGKFKLVWPEHAPQALRCARGRGAQYKMILRCREAPACLPRPNGVAEELHK
jgi:hypothetical protein